MHTVTLHNDVLFKVFINDLDVGFKYMLNNSAGDTKFVEAVESL